MQSMLKKGAIGLALVSGGVLLGGVAPISPEAQGEVRAGAPPQTFKSGSQLSVPVLQEIATTLRQIDTRLARLEALAVKMQTRQAALPSGN